MSKNVKHLLSDVSTDYIQIIGPDEREGTIRVRCGEGSTAVILVSSNEVIVKRVPWPDE